jgi:hypothetical protein
VKVQTIKKTIRLREWAAQISACNQSGLTVRQWCAENGVNPTTYYNRLKRVQEEMLEAVEASNLAPGALCPSEGTSNLARPVFAALPIPKAQPVAVTVRLGECEIGIQNGADHALLEQVLKVVARL